MYDKSIAETENEFSTDISIGLSEIEVRNRLEQFGENSFGTQSRKTFLKLIIAQLSDFLLLILIIAAVISIVLGETTDGIIILSVVALNIVLGVYQERKADNAFNALKKLSSPHAKVIRDNKIIQVETNTLVPGDIVVLETGDYVPADLRLCESVNLKADESSLTGESIAVDKTIDVITTAAALGDRTNLAFMNSIVTYGRGKGIVIATGTNTELGKIASLLKQTPEQLTPLQRKLNSFSKILGYVCIGVCVLIFAVGLLRQIPLMELFMTSISLAVAAIPEGLTVVVTVMLALGMQRMVKNNAIIKKLSAVEALGSVTVICSDKTGTLTQNKMHVEKVFTHNVNKLLEVSLLCNDAKEEIGDPTEIALINFGNENGAKKTELDLKFPRQNEIPFDSKRKLMSTMNSCDGKMIMHTKGAPDELIKRCKFILQNDEVIPLSDESISEITELNKSYANDAYRVLAMAYKVTDGDLTESELIFVGMVGMIDPPRLEVADAIKTCATAGIDVKMITGDHKLTADAIAKTLGISTENVYARVAPEDKVEIVKTLKENGHIVAMTGDGVNDAPALKRADIGIAMGITGTDVAKEAADMILTDDNFTSIVKAVKEGRIIYSNIQKVIAYLLSCNIGEIIIIFMSMIMGLPIPLAPIHLLSINLITDTFPAFALGMEPGEKNIMNRLPNNPNESIINKRMQMFITVQSIALAAGSLISFYIVLMFADYITASTACFVTLVIGELLRAYSSRSDSDLLLNTKVFGNKFLNRCVIFSCIFLLSTVYVPFVSKVFSTIALSPLVFVIAIALAFIPILSGELFKILYRENKY